MDLAKETKGLIHNVLTSSKQTLTMRKLNSEYYQLIGSNIPFSKLGFPTLEMYLRSLPDILKIYGQGEHAEVRVIVGDKSAHVRELISKQRDAKKPAGRGRRNCSFAYTQPQNFRHGTVLSNQRANVPTVVYFGNQVNGSFYGGINHHVPPLLNLPYIQQGSNQNFARNSSYMYSSQHNQRHTSSRNVANKPISGSNDQQLAREKNRPDSSSRNVVAAGASTNNGRKTDDLKSQEKLHGVVAYADLKGKGPDLSEDEVYFSDEEQSKVPQVVRDNLRGLISKHPNGIWCSEIPNAYKKQFGVDLNYVDYGYTSLSQMCMDLGNSFKCAQLKQGDYKIFDKLYSVNLNPPNTNTKKHESSKLANVSADPALPKDGVEDFLSNIHNVPVPSDVVKSGEFIERQWMDRGAQVSTCLVVNVGEIFDPSKFWLNLCEYGSELNALMDNMQQFYRRNWRMYEAPHFALKTGLYVAAVILKEYHRALVVDTTNDHPGMIKLFFIDYGTVSVENSAGVCYLCRQFADLPAQGIRARLAGIRPPVQGEPWSRKAARRFQSMVADKDLVAQIINVDEEKEILDVVLCDKGGEEDFFINDALVSEEFAAFSQCQVSSNRIDDSVHLCPTFAELENGMMWTDDQINRAFTFGKRQYFKSFSAGNEMQDLCALVESAGKKDTCFQTDVKQTQNEYRTVMPPPGFNYIIPTITQGVTDHALIIVNGDVPAAPDLNARNAHRSAPVMSSPSNLNPNAVPFRPTLTGTPIPHSGRASSTSNNTVNINTNGVNQNSITSNANQDQASCTIEFSALRSETVEIVPFLHRTAIHSQDGGEDAKESVIKKCHVRVGDSFRLVTKTTLQDGIIHVIAHDGDDYFLVDEIVYGLLGTTLSIVQIRKMFVGTQNMIPAFASVNLNRAPSLKRELIEHDLIQGTTVWVNVAPVSCLLYFMAFLTKMPPRPFLICN